MPDEGRSRTADDLHIDCDTLFSAIDEKTVSPLILRSSVKDVQSTQRDMPPSASKTAGDLTHLLAIHSHAYLTRRKPQQQQRSLLLDSNEIAIEIDHFFPSATKRRKKCLPNHSSTGCAPLFRTQSVNSIPRHYLSASLSFDWAFLLVWILRITPACLWKNNNSNAPSTRSQRCANGYFQPILLSSRSPSGDTLRQAESFRIEASQLVSQAKTLSKQSPEEYNSGVRAQAKALSNEKARLYQQANERNQLPRLWNGRSSGISPERERDQCRSEKIQQLTVITGIVNNASDSTAKVKPAVEKFAHQHGLKMIPCVYSVYWSS